MDLSQTNAILKFLLHCRHSLSAEIPQGWKIQSTCGQRIFDQLLDIMHRKTRILWQGGHAGRKDTEFLGHWVTFNIVS